MDLPADEPRETDSRATWLAERGRQAHLEAVSFLIHRLAEPTGIPEVDAVSGVDAGRVVPEATLEGDLGLDSLGVVELLMALEDRFGFTVSQEEAARIVTVGDLAALVVARTLAAEVGDERPG